MKNETEVALNLNDYQMRALTTAVFPIEHEVTYPALGLADEIGELLSADLEDKDNVIAEMGDVMWYCSVLAGDLCLSLQDCYDNATKSGWTDGHALFNNAALICGRVKKILRGDADYGTKVTDIQGYIGDIVLRIQSIASQFDVPLEEVCERNIDKLFDRKERGVLKGDGDNR